MLGKIDWETQIGRRIKLRDLQVFFTVVQNGSMAKAATQLGVSQPAVSEIIAGLEHALGVRLLDRSSRGVEPTIYGRALLKGGTAAFDDLKESIREIETLADPTAGELHVGCAEATASALLPSVIERFMQQYPRVVIRLTQLVTPTLELPELRERKLDVIVARFMKPVTDDDDNLNKEILFDDRLVVVAGKHSRWASRHKIDLVELANEPWLLTPSESWNKTILTEAFRARGLDMPKACLMTFSVHLRAKLIASGPYISAFPSSVMRLNANEFALKVLPIDLPARPWPVAVVTLKNRTLSPVAQLFIDHLRDFTRSIASELDPERATM